MSEADLQRDVTRLIQNLGGSDRTAADQLLTLVYDQLRKIAQQRMNEERRDHTLQATALVHEAYLRLVGDADVQWQGRGHFFAAAAEAMRKLLIDHARKKGAAKRGAGVRALASVVDLASDEKIADAIVLDDLILRLETEEPRAAQVVRLRFYAGLSIEETAQSLGASVSTVKNEWSYARAWLAAAWQGSPDERGDSQQPPR